METIEKINAYKYNGEIFERESESENAHMADMLADVIVDKGSLKDSGNNQSGRHLKDELREALRKVLRGSGRDEVQSIINLYNKK